MLHIGARLLFPVSEFQLLYQYLKSYSSPKNVKEFKELKGKFKKRNYLEMGLIVYEPAKTYGML